jgi:hypothetical protein
MIELDPAYKLRLASIDHLASTGPVAYLTDEAVAGLREHALRLGPIGSLAICMLHETPASVRRIASLSITDFAQDGKGQTYAILGRSAATNVPCAHRRRVQAHSAPRCGSSRGASCAINARCSGTCGRSTRPVSRTDPGSASSSTPNATSLTWMRFSRR